MKIISLVTALIAITACTAFAQQRAEIQNYESRRAATSATASGPAWQDDSQSVPQLVEAEEEDFGVQRIVRMKKYRKWVEVYLDNQFQYTDNFLLSETAIQDSTVMISTAEFAVAPDAYEIGEGYYSPRIGYRHIWFNYGLGTRADTRFNNFDFDVQTLFTSHSYRFMENWVASLGADFTRLLSHEPPNVDYQEFYKEALINWGMTRLIPIGEETSAYVSVDQSYAFTEVDPVFLSSTLVTPSDVNDRLSNNLTLGLNHKIFDSLSLSPYYQLRFVHYTVNHNRDERNDLIHALGLGLNYKFTEWGSARTYFNWETRDTSDPAEADYSRITSGVGAAINLRF